MLIRHLKVSGLLSFGPRGIDLALKPLNVLIGPNGSGKSNLLEVLALLRAAPTNLSQPVREMGGIREWLWKGPASHPVATIDALIDYVLRPAPLRHVLEIAEHGERFEMVGERVETREPRLAFLPGQTEPQGSPTYRLDRGIPELTDASGNQRRLSRESLKPDESILSQVRDPELYPALHWLQDHYEKIRLYRTWTFGPTSAARREQSAHGRSDSLSDGGENLALVLAKIRARVKRELIESLQRLYAGIEDIHITVDGGNVLLFLEESSGRTIPSTRLSDGTLRYLGLLAVLLHPEPPPLVAIEEPELGLHPDILPHIADLLVDASQRTQLIVTTHSRILIDALTDHPEAVIVCGQQDGESHFERLDPEAMKEWLERYSLGDLWSRGEIGGNRW
jgi:predicted ATPase